MSRVFQVLGSPWDRRACRGGAAFTLTLTCLAVALTAATDEGGVSWSERLARAMPLVPACGALATWLTIVGGERRGERRALEALGRSPSSTRLAAALGAFGVGVVAALLVLIDGKLSLSAFFPTVHTSGGFVLEGGTFASVRAGFRVMADGSIALPAAPAVPPPSAGDLALLGSGLSPRVSASAFVAVTSAAFAATLVSPARAPAYAGVPPRMRSQGAVALVLLLVTAAASMLCLQAAAAGRLPAFAAVAPSSLLLVFAVTAIVRGERG